jgi:hypothetical protein
MKRMTEKDKYIKVTATWYYQPKFGPQGNYWEPGSEWDGFRGFPTAETVVQAAESDKESFHEGDLSLPDWIVGLAEEEDFDLLVEVVEFEEVEFKGEVIGPIEHVVYTCVDKDWHEEEPSPTSLNEHATVEEMLAAKARQTGPFHNPFEED